MVYNFALPPLVLSTFYGGDATVLSRWAAGLEAPSPLATFFNILDTHDGIGLMGAREILSGGEMDFLIREAAKRGAYVSFRLTEDQSEEPYEINATWWSAVNGDEGADLELQVKRYTATRSIALALRGVPGIYVHGALGTVNNHEAVRRTGVKREVNRGIIDGGAMVRDLEDRKSKLSLVTRLLNRLCALRTGNRAFYPRGGQRVLFLSPEVFSVLRFSATLRFSADQQSLSGHYSIDIQFPDVLKSIHKKLIFINKFISNSEPEYIH